MKTKDPIFGSLENDTYAILHAIKEDLDRECIPCTVYHFGQALGRGECLELDLPDSDCALGPQLMFNNNQLVFCFVLLGVPDPESPLYPKKDIITAVDICDPNGFQTIVDSIKKWYHDAGYTQNTSEEEP